MTDVIAAFLEGRAEYDREFASVVVPDFGFLINARTKKALAMTSETGGYKLGGYENELKDLGHLLRFGRIPRDVQEALGNPATLPAAEKIRWPELRRALVEAGIEKNGALLDRIRPSEGQKFVLKWVYEHGPTRYHDFDQIRHGVKWALFGLKTLGLIADDSAGTFTDDGEYVAKRLVGSGWQPQPPKVPKKPKKRRSFKDEPWKKDDPNGKLDTIRHIWDEGAAETYCRKSIWPLTISRSDRGTRDCTRCARVAAKRAKETGEPVRRPRDPASANLAEREVAHARLMAGVEEDREASPAAEDLSILREEWQELFIDTVDTDAAAWNARFAFDAEAFDAGYITRALDARFAHWSSPEGTAFIGMMTAKSMFGVKEKDPAVANPKVALAVVQRLEAGEVPHCTADLPNYEEAILAENGTALLVLLRRDRSTDVLLGVHVSGEGVVAVTIYVMLVVRSEDAAMQLTAVEQVGALGQRGPCLAEVGEALSRLGINSATEAEQP